MRPEPAEQIFGPTISRLEVTHQSEIKLGSEWDVVEIGSRGTTVSTGGCAPLATPAATLLTLAPGTDELKVLHNNLEFVPLAAAILVLPGGELETSLGEQLTALAHVLIEDLGLLAKHRHIDETGRLALLAFLGGGSTINRHAEFGDSETALGVAKLDIPREVAEKNDLVEVCHDGLRYLRDDRSQVEPANVTWDADQISSFAAATPGRILVPKMNLERRRAPRATASIPLLLSPRGDAQPATLVNISTSGLGCQFGEAMTEMTLVGIGVQLPGQESVAELKGAVVRCDKVRGVNPPTYEIGIFFTDMPDATRKSIQEFVDAQISAQVEG